MEKSSTLGLVEVVMRDGKVVVLSPARARAMATALIELAEAAEKEDRDNPVLLPKAE